MAAQNRETAFDVAHCCRNRDYRLPRNKACSSEGKMNTPMHGNFLSATLFLNMTDSVM